MIVLRKNIFRHITAFDYVDTQAYLEAVEKILPQYQPLFEKYKGNLDWRLLAAVAYQESHWDPYATSPTGVRGMMMLTKDTAVRMNINNRTDAEQSIKAGSGVFALATRPNCQEQYSRRRSNLVFFSSI